MPDKQAEVLVISLLREAAEENFTFLQHSIHLQRLACNGDEQTARELIRQYDGKVDVMAVEGMPGQLQLAEAHTPVALEHSLQSITQHTPAVDGCDIRDALERWSLYQMGTMQAGLFNRKQVLFVPGLNYASAVHAIVQFKAVVRFADPVLFFKLLPHAMTTSKLFTHLLAPVCLQVLKNCDRVLLRDPRPRQQSKAMQRLIDWADVIIGDSHIILNSLPGKLENKTLVVEYIDEAQLALLQQCGATQVFTLMPPLIEGRDTGRLSIAALNGVLQAVSGEQVKQGSALVNLLTKHSWQPGRRVFKVDKVEVNRFAFVIHPLNIKGIHAHPKFRWTRFLPNALVEFVAAYMPPLFITRITGGQSPLTGQSIEGDIYAVVATPRQMMLHKPALTYKRINRITHMAERRGARIIGLGAFTSVVGDAGYTIAHESDIAVTSGNSLTAAAAIDALKWAAQEMGMTEIGQCRVMVLGATGSIGAVCARWLAEQVGELVLVSRRPEKLLHLKQQIENETPKAKVSITTCCNDVLPDCDLVISATSAFGQRVLDISRCKPGAVICDVARPHDINPKEAALRPDVLVIDGGEVQIPGEIKIGYDIGLPPGVVYACMAETALLAMAGRFEDYTLGRDLDLDKVKEIHALYLQHQFKLSALHSFGNPVTAEQLADKRELATALRVDAELYQQTREEAAQKISRIPPAAKGVTVQAALPAWLFWLSGKVLALLAWPLRLLLRC